MVLMTGLVLIRGPRSSLHLPMPLGGSRTVPPTVPGALYAREAPDPTPHRPSARLERLAGAVVTHVCTLPACWGWKSIRVVATPKGWRCCGCGNRDRFACERADGLRVCGDCARQLHLDEVTG